MRRSDTCRADVEPGLVSVTVVNYEGGELLQTCLRSVYDQSIPVQVIVVDNGSSDGSACAAVERFSDLQVVRPADNLGFAGGANAGARRACGEFLLFLNPDVELGRGCLQALVRALSVPGVGVVGPVLRVLASDRLEYGATIDLVGHPIGLSEPGAPLYVPGCALALRSSVFQELGGFDDRFFLFMEDVDLCWRALLAGYDVQVVSEAFATHVGGASAPGGYPTHAGVVTSRMRVSLRQRNTLAMLVKCLGSAALTPILVASLLETVATAGVLAVSGYRQTAADVLRGVAWNLKELPRTLALRRKTQALRRVPDREILRRMRFTLHKAEILARHGILVDEET